jgi:hypothetical protein
MLLGDQAFDLRILGSTKGPIDSLQSVDPRVQKNDAADGLTVAGTDGAAELSGHRF